MIRIANSLREQNGASLLEVLVAVLVIAIGLLGLAGLQTAGFNNTHISYLRSIASIHTENMAELMRANRAAVDANIYSAGAGAGSIDYANLAIALAPDPDCIASASSPSECSPAPTPDCRVNFSAGVACSPTDQAMADASYWLINITSTLPGGRGVVTCNDSVTGDGDPCTDGSPHTISVSWQERDFELLQPDIKTFSTVVRP